MENGKLKRSNRCWLVLVACCLMCGVGFGGGMTCMSLFVAPLVALLEVPVTAVTLFFTIATLACIPAVIVGPRLLEKNAQVVAGICGVIMGICFIAISMSPSLATLYVAAVAFGLTYPIATTILSPILINNWFAKKQGTMVGIALGCIGIGSAILSPLLTAVIASAGWHVGMMTLGAIIIVVVGGCGFLIVRLTPASVGVLPYGASEDGAVPGGVENGTGNGDASQIPGLAYKEFFKSPAVIALALAIAFAGLTACINQQANTVAQLSGFTPVVAGLVVTCSSVGNIVGSLVLGWVRDKTNGCVTSLVGGVVMIAGFACMLGGLAEGSEMLMYVGGFLCGVGTCLGTMASPLFTMDAAGPRDYGAILGTLSVFATVGNAIAAPIVSGVFDVTGSYSGSIVLLAVLALLMIPLTFVGIKGQQKRWKR